MIEKECLKSAVELIVATRINLYMCPNLKYLQDKVEEAKESFEQALTMYTNRIKFDATNSNH